MNIDSQFTWVNWHQSCAWKLPYALMNVFYSWVRLFLEFRWLRCMHGRNLLWRWSRLLEG